jgi:dihydrofolate synthase/folylpolyglutamate synthase
MQTLDKFLQSKPLYYKEIDHQRVFVAYNKLKPHINEPTNTIHIVGTNGKGSTGRIISHLAHKATDKSIGHYTSPHILKFNERIWIDGEDSSDEVLESAHQRLYKILGKELSDRLSYFEYTTLLALVVFENSFLAVLEAGLGGEYDATNVCDKNLSVITPIGLDHQAFLGDSIEQIATTKINSIKSKAIIAPQEYPQVYEVATTIAASKGATITQIEPTAHKHYAKVKKIATSKQWGEYLVDNAIVALSALEALGIEYDVDDLNSLELFGRYYPLAPNIRIDVGHNPLAAKALAKSIKKPVTLIYNSLDDKDYTKVLSILKPKIKYVQIIPIHSQRAATLQQIEEALTSLKIPYTNFQNQIDEKSDYLVFGSFYVVEEFLKWYKNKR